MERRGARRLDVAPIIRIAAHHERRLPPAAAINVSDRGMLVSFDEPIGLMVGETVVASLADRVDPHDADEPDATAAWTHVVGRVTRTARGEDFRTYIAVEFDERYRTAAASLLTVLTPDDDARSAGDGDLGPDDLAL